MFPCAFRALFTAWLLCHGAVAWACAICAPSAAEQTLTQRLYKSEQVALGVNSSVAGQYSITVPVRGVDPGLRIDGVTLVDDGVVPASGASVLLAQSGGTWRVMALMPAGRAAWVQRLIAMRRAPDAKPADADWDARFAFFAPDLENAVAAVAQVAYEELAVAPYGAMRKATKTFGGLPLSHWLEQPRLQDRHPLYALMAGFAAKPGQAAAFEQRLLDRSSRESLATSSALLAAVLELRGEAGLAWMREHYLQESGRTDTEVQAALLALRVHASDGGKIGKEAAVTAIRAFVQANPQRAGFAASDLGDWGRWEFGADFEHLLDTDQSQVFASRYAMVLYLLRSPHPDAKLALERLRAKGRL